MLEPLEAYFRLLKQWNAKINLVSAADKLYMKGYFERVGPLLDEAAAKVPHRAEPMMMSVNLAQKTKDPRRMAEALDRLLSLGWPGQDEYFRTESRTQAEILAKALREEGRVEADAPARQGDEPGTRDVFLRLTGTVTRFRPTVEEPLGAQRTIKRRTVSAARWSRTDMALTPTRSTSAHEDSTAITPSASRQSTPTRASPRPA
jgi:hypothetical protein